MSSAAIRFACPVCDGNIRAPAGQLGHDVLCPHCGNTVTVPDDNQSAPPSRQAAGDKNEAPPQAESERPSAAAPVIDPDGVVIGAVQAAGHQEDVPLERVDQLGVEVQRAAFAIARRAF